MTDCANEAVGAAFRSVGIAAEVLPPPDARTLELGVRYLTGDECLPAKVTLGDFLKVAEAPGFDPTQVAFFMPTTEGPCRFGQYTPFIRRVFRQIGYPEVAIISLTSGDGYQRCESVGTAPHRAAWRAIAASDLLRKCLLKTRPYELTLGDTDHAYAAAIRDLCAALEVPGLSARKQLAALVRTLNQIRGRFRAIPAHYTRDRVFIGVQGETFCRMEEFSNDRLIRRLEAYGAEVWLSDISEWVWYCNVDQEESLRRAGRRLSGAMLGARLRDHVQHADEWALRAPFAQDFRGYEEPRDVCELLQAGRPYLPRSGAAGEMVLSAGKVEYLFRMGVDGIIDVSPFSCMNGIVSEALYPRQSADHTGLPIKNFYFDGTGRDLVPDLEIFLELARAYRQIKQHPRRFPSWFN
jgi:predicted nucleotide-binding protein (sugar kinase/HSP70/actin superfamily)